MIITWPDQTTSKINKPEINKVHTIQKPTEAIAPIYTTIHKTEQVFELSNSVFEKHTEDDFVDFYLERNIPVMLSREGPKAAVADVNKDGLDDIFIGGAKGQPGQLYLQTPNGFIKKSQPAFESDRDFEDVAAVFFDCDNDGDLDLFVGAGGNDLPPRNPLLSHRLYRNDNGNFKKDTAAFPSNSSNISVAIPMDYDNDGDLDLFVGGRSISYNYGATPASYIYENDGTGKFTDVTAKLNPEIAKIGMVTSAIWQEVTGDNKKDLVIVGEWMTPRIFSFVNGKMAEVTTNLSGLYGWWQSLAVADMDGDGDNDLVLGNYGGNFYLCPDSSKPVKLWVNDFDLNGLPDKVFSRTVNGKDVSVFLKKDFTDALPSMKKENLRHHAFANKTIQTLFSPQLIQTAIVKTFNYPKSCIAFNDGNGRFTIKELPVIAQLSSVNSILCKDVNKDGRIDLILGGNIICCLPQFGRLDADYGTVLLNKGNKEFVEMPPTQTGIAITGMVRDIAWIPARTNDYILFLRNDDYPVMYSLKK